MDEWVNLKRKKVGKLKKVGSNNKGEQWWEEREKVNDGRGKKGCRKKNRSQKETRKNSTWSIFRALLGLVLHLLRKRFARRGLLRLLLLRRWLLWSFDWGSTPLQDNKRYKQRIRSKVNQTPNIKKKVIPFSSLGSSLASERPPNLKNLNSTPTPRPTPARWCRWGAASLFTRIIKKY